MVEFFSDSKEVIGSIPIVPILRNEKFLEVWQRGLLQKFAKLPCRLFGTAGSNPATSVEVTMTILAFALM